MYIGSFFALAGCGRSFVYSSLPLACFRTLLPAHQLEYFLDQSFLLQNLSYFLHHLLHSPNNPLLLPHLHHHLHGPCIALRPLLHHLHLDPLHPLLRPLAPRHQLDSVLLRLKAIVSQMLIQLLPDLYRPVRHIHHYCWCHLHHLQRNCHYCQLPYLVTF